MSRTAKRFFESADASLQRRLDRCFDQLKTEPRRHPNIKTLKGPLAGHLRYRIGNYRVLYTVNDEDSVVIVVVIAHRGTVYG